MSEYVFDLSAFESEELDDGMREEIVRCRDCKFADDDIRVCYREGEIGDDLYYPRIEPNGFCAWSCRKEDGDD